METLNAEIVIIGAGPAGLAAAIELGRRSISCLVLEQNDRVGCAPRAKTTHVRTREHLRRWGIAEHLADEAPFGVNYPSDVVFVTSLAGRQLARFKNAFHCSPTRNDLSPEHAQWVPQYKLEEVLRNYASSLPSVTIRFNCAFDSCTQHETTIVSQIKDLLTGDAFTVRSAFLIGADGARSRVRDVIGAKMEGNADLSRNYNIVFQAPGLAQAHSHGPAIMYWQISKGVSSLIGPMDSGDRWFFMPTGVPNDFSVSGTEAADLIRRTTGIDLPYHILSTDEWIARRLLADRYRRGRIFLTGDACHLHPPFGGYGMNMGISDSVDIGWKLAAFLRGWGGEALLESYETERRPVHQRVIDEATNNHAVLGKQLWRGGLEDETALGVQMRRKVGQIIETAKEREFCNLGIVLGYCYSSPLIAKEPGSAAWQNDTTYVPSALPGRIAPHFWLSETTALYDVFGDEFTLLALRGSDSMEVETIVEDAKAIGVPVTIIRNADPRLADLYKASYVLIRPDQHVAWRGNAWLGAWILRKVTGQTSPESILASPQEDGHN